MARTRQKRAAEASAERERQTRKRANKQLKAKLVKSTPVSPEELRDAIVQMVATKFVGRHLDLETARLGVRWFILDLQQLALQVASAKRK